MIKQINIIIVVTGRLSDFFVIFILSSFFASGGQGVLFEKTAPWTPAKTFI
jgi:hypothetical protein